METVHTSNESTSFGDELVVVAQITGAFGRDGSLKIQPFVTLAQVLEPGIKLFIDETPVHVKYINWNSRHPILQLLEIKTMDQAAALTGMRLDELLKLPVWMGFIASYILDILTCLTKITFPLSLRRLKAMTQDVTYSNKKIIYTLNVKAKYGIQQGIINTITWYHKSGLL